MNGKKQSWELARFKKPCFFLTQILQKIFLF